MYGAEAVRLAIEADRASREFGISVIFDPQAVDIAAVARETQNLYVFAQHMDPVEIGRGNGKRASGGDQGGRSRRRDDQPFRAADDPERDRPRRPACRSGRPGHARLHGFARGGRGGGSVPPEHRPFGATGTDRRRPVCCHRDAGLRGANQRSSSRRSTARSSSCARPGSRLRATSRPWSSSASANRIDQRHPQGRGPSRPDAGDAGCDAGRLGQAPSIHMSRESALAKAFGSALTGHRNPPTRGAVR